MSEITVIRTYKIAVADKDISKVRSMGGSVSDMAVAITHLADGGDLNGQVVMAYFWDHDAEAGCYEWLDLNDLAEDSDHHIALTVAYRVTETTNDV